MTVSRIRLARIALLMASIDHHNVPASEQFIVRAMPEPLMPTGAAHPDMKRRKGEKKRNKANRWK